MKIIKATRRTRFERLEMNNIKAMKQALYTLEQYGTSGWEYLKAETSAALRAAIEQAAQEPVHVDVLPAVMTESRNEMKITIDAAVVQQALDALDVSQALQEYDKSQHHPKTLAAYNALRAAIEQAAQEPVDLEYAYQKTMAPVEPKSLSRYWFTAGYNAAANNPAPAQPTFKPLSQDQILDAFCTTPGINQFVSAFTAGARFAEQAHGIKEQS